MERNSQAKFGEDPIKKWRELISCSRWAWAHLRRVSKKLEAVDWLSILPLVPTSRSYPHACLKGSRKDSCLLLSDKYPNKR